MFRFEYIEFLYAFLLLPVLVIIFWAVRRNRKKALKTIGEPELISRLMPDVSSAKPALKLFLLLAALSGLIMGLANPQIGSKLEEVKRKGVDMVIALDVSNSMLAEDLQPNRLERAKQAISRLVDKLRGDQIGIVVFAGKAFVQLPITYDYSAAKLFINSIRPELVPVQGTAIGEAIDVSMKSLNYSDDEKVKARSRVIIIISDGENHEDDALGSAQKAAGQGIIVHAIGMGSPEGAPIPIYKNNAPAGFLKDKEGNVVVTKMNEAMLQQVAAAGNGIYFRGTNIESGLSALFTELNKMEKKEIGSKIFTDYEDRFQYFLAIALFMLILEFLIPERKTKWFSRMKFYTIAVLTLTLPALSPAQDERTLIRKGNEMYKSEKFNDAEINYRKSLQKNNKSAEGNFNLGDAMYKQGNYPEAANQFEMLAHTEKDKKKLAGVYHNLGNSLLQAKKYPESINAYKQSLKLNPKDDDTRYNLAYAKRMIQQQQQQQQQQQNKQDKNEQQQQKQQQQQDDKKEQKEQQQSQPQKKEDISRENAERLLDAMNNEEKDVQDKLLKQKIQGQKIPIDKNW